MTNYRCPYCHQALGDNPSARCPGCGKAMVLPQTAKPTSRRVKRKDRSTEDALPPAAFASIFRPGRNPAFLGAIILVFIVLGSLLSSQFARQSVTQEWQDDPIARAQREIFALHTALERFQADTGRFPTPEEGLRALVLDPGVQGWQGNYVNLIKPDPWRTPYRYTLATDGPEVRSAGPDRTFHTEQDITL